MGQFPGLDDFISGGISSLFGGGETPVDPLGGGDYTVPPLDLSSSTASDSSPFDWRTDSGAADLAASSGVGDLTKSGGSDKGIFDSLLSSFTSPAGLASLLGVTSNYLQGSAQLQAAKDKQQADEETQRMNYLLELAKMKYSPGGGGSRGGGGGSNLARYQLLLNASQNDEAMRSKSLQSLGANLAGAYK